MHLTSYFDVIPDKADCSIFLWTNARLSEWK